MDGNGRWAKKRFLPRLAGHKQGVEALRACVQDCRTRGVRVLTVFAFSSENWNRPADEVSGLMDILAMALSREVSQLQRDGVRLHFVGSREGFIDPAGPARACVHCEYSLSGLAPRVGAQSRVLQQLPEFATIAVDVGGANHRGPG